MASVHTTSHPAALAARTWLMYGKGKKQQQMLKPACGSDIPVTLILLKHKKRQQLYSEVLERLSVKGARRKMLQEVWRVVVSQLSALKDSQHLNWCRNAWIDTIFLPIKTFTPRFLLTIATPLALGISWLSRGLLRSNSRMTGSVFKTAQS